jgi:hypothetical protein
LGVPMDVVRAIVVGLAVLWALEFVVIAALLVGALGRRRFRGRHRRHA